MTSTQVEKKLKRFFWLKKEVMAKEQRLDELITAATHITAVLAPVRASTSGISSKPEDYAIRSFELKMDLEDDMNRLIIEMTECERMISILEEPLQRAILIDYHFNGIPLRKLEDKYHYSRKQIYNIRQTAYENIAHNYTAE